MSKRYIHIVWSKEVAVGPLVAYTRLADAARHAQAMLGVEEVATVELKDRLDENVLMDLETDYEDDSVTPVELVDIDDA